MDLLHGYGSSDDDEEVNTRPSSAKALPTAKNDAKQAKVLKLAAVLPPEILERLERADDASSSSEEDDEDTKVTGKTKGVSTLLTSLQSIKPKNASPFPVQAFSTPTSTTATPPASAAPTKPPHPQPVVKDIASSQVNSTRKVSLNVVKPSSAVFAAPRVRAAPPVQESIPSAISTPSTAASNSSSTTASSTPTLNNNNNNNNTTSSPRKRRQQIERALRNGHVTAVHTTGHATTAMGDSTSVHVVDYESAQTIRNVPEGVYDPSTGKLSTAGKRGAGKNQVHFLVHQAAALERQRAEKLGSSSSNSGRNRADAKRKYGF